MVDLTKYKEIVNFKEGIVGKSVKERNLCFYDESGGSLF